MSTKPKAVKKALKFIATEAAEKRITEAELLDNAQLIMHQYGIIEEHNTTSEQAEKAETKKYWDWLEGTYSMDLLTLISDATSILSNRAIDAEEKAKAKAEAEAGSLH